jgi:putative transposase
MPRRARIDAPGALHHVIVRGHCKERNLLRQRRSRPAYRPYREGVCRGEDELLRLCAALEPRSPASDDRRSARCKGHETPSHRLRRLVQQARDQGIFSKTGTSRSFARRNPTCWSWSGNFGLLDSYPYSGHSAVMGRRERHWQDVEYVLKHFSDKIESARALPFVRGRGRSAISSEAALSAATKDGVRQKAPRAGKGTNRSWEAAISRFRL